MNASFKFWEIFNNHFYCSYPAVVAEWVHKGLQIQVALSHRSQVWIPLRTCYYDGEIVTKKQLYPALTYSISCDQYSESCVQCKKIIIRTVNCDVRKRIKATWCHNNKKIIGHTSVFLVNGVSKWLPCHNPSLSLSKERLKSCHPLQWCHMMSLLANFSYF